jgi:glycolate oxidase FAD binding subunit
MGYPVEPDIVVSSHGLNSIVDWQAEDLTIVVQPGVLVADLETRLEQAGQTAVLPEVAGAATVGGVVAAGVSGWRRLRYGPIRDRMLEVRLATGDGRVVRGGGRVVKNVTGYDIPRLVTGSFGSLGMIADVCLKLWPLSAGRATVAVDDPVEALRASYRPLAVIETNEGVRVFLSGTPEELEAQAGRLGGVPVEGHDWPEPLNGSVVLVLRMPQGETARGVQMVAGLGGRYQAAHGIGEIRFTADDADVAELELLRRQAEAVGGSLVIVEAPADLGLDPWGAAPGTVELQRRVKAAFDPRGIANPGILPGGV